MPYFQHCSNLHLREIIETGYRQVLSKSDVLFHEGKTGTAIYIILSGAIEMVSTRLEQCIRIHRAGELLGEAYILLSIPYVATARALEETSLFVIQKKHFEKLLLARPQLAEVLAEELSKEKAIYTEVRQKLQEMGLLDMNEHHYHFVGWVQARLKKLLGIQ